jgi:microcystin degradation protein MlrC
MRVIVGGISHESNTFLERLTGREAFAQGSTTRGAALLEAWQGTNSEVAGFAEEAAVQGLELVPTLLAWAMPAGRVADDAFEALVGELLERIAAAGPVAGVLLCLHGALATERYQDGDGEVLRRVRALVGPSVPIAATLDFHANVSPLMAEQADILVGYDTYPHVDLRERGRECAALLARTLRGEVRPALALSKAPLVPNILRQATEAGPMATLIALAHAAEAEPGLLSVSVTAGFPYADVECLGLGCLALADGDHARAQAVADRITAWAWENRHAFAADAPGPTEAVAQALASPRGPVVLVDVGDNVGGGTPGDGTFLLAELLAREAQGAVVMLADPEAVAQAIAAGVRSEVTLAVGGKVDAHHGPPVTVRGRVRLIADGVYQNRGPMRDGIVDDMGRTVVLQCGGLTLILTERKMPMWNLEQLRALGIEPTRQRVIVVKAAIAHRAAYSPIAAAMIEVDTPGLTAPDIRRYHYHHAPRPLWPLDPG